MRTGFLAVLALLLGSGWVVAEQSATPDEVILKDGSRLVGTIKGLGNGVLEVASGAADGGSIKVKFEEVKSIRSGGSHDVVCDDGSRIVGVITTDASGQLVVQRGGAGGTVPLSMSTVTAIDPPVVPPLQQRFRAVANGRVEDGNTHSKKGSGEAEYEARTAETRLTIYGATHYEETSGDVTARSSNGKIKYDYFATERLFAYVATSFRGDEFADLELRTTVGGGMGYQFFDRALDSLPVSYYEEVGLSYFDENFIVAPDDSYATARVSGKMDWSVNDWVEFFHFHEVFPSLEDSADVTAETRTGLRFKLLANFFANFQVNYDWDNTPPAGTRRHQTEYLMGVGCDFKF